MRRRVLYLGLPLGALCLLSDGLEVAAACISRPDQPGMRRLRRLLGDVSILEKPDLTSAAIVDRLRQLNADQIVSWFWTKQIPEDVIALAPFAFNVHPSLLPRHRGADPYFWTLACGDRVSGVTAHLLTARYDEGPILEQRELEVPEGVNAWRLARALDRPSLALMREIASRYGRGEDLRALTQDEALATHAPEPTDADCELRWSWPAAKVLARIRAAAPWPGAFTEYGDRTIVITQAALAKNPAALAPGQAALGSDGVVVAAADAAIVLIEARAEDDDSSMRGRAIAALFPGLPSV